MTLISRHQIWCASVLLKNRRVAKRFFYALEILCFVITIVWGGVANRIRAAAVVQGIGGHRLLYKNIEGSRLAVGSSTPYLKQVKPGLKAEKFFRGWGQALGGQERIRRIVNIHIRGRIETGTLSGIFEEWRTAKGQRKQNLELGEVVRQLTVFNGKKSWVLDQNDNLQELAGTDLKNEVTAAYLGSFSI